MMCLVLIFLTDMSYLPEASGIPPKRNDQEFESQRFEYPTNRGKDENLSQTKVVFNTYLYSNVFPKTTEQALPDPKWKKSMEEEITALEKNKTWEQCTLPRGKKIVGRNGCL